MNNGKVITSLCSVVFVKSLFDVKILINLKLVTPCRNVATNMLNQLGLRRACSATQSFADYMKKTEIYNH